MSDKYVINADNSVSPMDDLVEWSSRFETDERRIAYTYMADGRIVSTVFLGIDHRFHNSGPPLIFETMVFPSVKDYNEEWCERTSTYGEARKTHEQGIAEAERLAGVSNPDAPARLNPATTYYR